jgi:hypothetical protein
MKFSKKNPFENFADQLIAFSNKILEVSTIRKINFIVSLFQVI